MPPETPLLSRATKVNISLLCLGFLLFILLMVTEFLTSVVVLLAASLILAYLLVGPVQFIEANLGRLKVGSKRLLSPSLAKALSILLVYLLLLGVFTVTGLRIVPQLSQQIREFAQDAPGYLSRMELSRPAPAVDSDQELAELVKESWKEEKQLPAVLAETESTETRQAVRQLKIRSATLRLASQKMVELYRTYASTLGGLLLNIGTLTLSGLVYGLTTLVLVFILLKDGRHLKQGFIDLMPTPGEAAVAGFLERVHQQLYSFIQAQVMISVLAGTLMYLLLYLLGIKYALMLGISFGLASILPVIGPWLGLVPIALSVAFSPQPTAILQVLLFAGMFYLLKVYWVWPQLVSRKYDTHPIIFILTFVVCLKLVGYLGILLSFPLASILTVGIGYVQDNQRQALPDSAD